MIELSDKDHDALDSVLGQILEWFRDDEISKLNAIGVIAHVFTAAATDNEGEVKAWLHNDNLSFWKRGLG